MGSERVGGGGGGWRRAKEREGYRGEGEEFC